MRIIDYGFEEIQCKFYFERRILDYRCIYYLSIDTNDENRVNIYFHVGGRTWAYWGSKKLYQTKKGFYIIHYGKREYLMEI